jgi:hypothetical protein
MMRKHKIGMWIIPEGTFDRDPLTHLLRRHGRSAMVLLIFLLMGEKKGSKGIQPMRIRHSITPDFLICCLKIMEKHCDR